MPVHTIQPTFAGGEFSPSLYSRVDLQKYATGLKKVKNFIIHPHGGASNRPGTMFVGESRNPTHSTTLKCRLIAFEFSVSQSYVLEFGDKYIRFYMNGAPIAIPASSPTWSAGATYVTDDYVKYNGVFYRALFASGNSGTNPSLNPSMWQSEPDGVYTVGTTYDVADIFDLKVTQSADVLYIVHPKYPPRELTRYDHDNWEMGWLSATDGPFMLMNTDVTKTITSSGTAKNASVTLSTSFDFFTSDMVFGPGSISISHDIPGQSIVQDLSSATATSSIKCGRTWRLVTTGTWQGTLKLEISTDSGSTWKELRALSSGASPGYNWATNGDEPEYCLIRANMSSFTSGTCHVNLTTDPFTKEGIVRLDSVTNLRTATGTVLKEVGATTATPDWAEGAWSQKNGFPSTVVFYQDRLLLAASTAEPQTIWASQTGSYKSFARSTPLVDTDGVTINLPSRKMNGINSLVGLAEVLALTSSTEWSVGPGSTGVFSPTSIETKVQGYRGSNTIEPVVIGNRCVYVQPMGSVVRDLSYEFASNGFTGNDLSLLSNHLFEGYTIVDMAYQQEPDSIVWFLRSDGKLLSLTYVKEHEVLAWSWHETYGVIESICSIPGNGYNELWAVVQRNNKRYIERFVQRMASTDPADQHFVDSGLVYEGAPTGIVSGLDHLEGKTVSILADGNVLPPQVVTGGQIDISGSGAASKVHVGLPYTSDLETLNVEVPAQDGTVQGRYVKISMVTIRFLNSRGGYLGPDENTLTEIIQRTGEPLGSAIQLYTGDQKETLSSSYDIGGRVFFRQSDPLPVTILAIMPTVTVGGG